MGNKQISSTYESCPSMEMELAKNFSLKNHTNDELIQWITTNFKITESTKNVIECLKNSNYKINRKEYHSIEGSLMLYIGVWDKITKNAFRKHCKLISINEQ